MAVRPLASGLRHEVSTGRELLRTCHLAHGLLTVALCEQCSATCVSSCHSHWDIYAGQSTFTRLPTDPARIEKHGSCRRPGATASPTTRTPSNLPERSRCHTAAQRSGGPSLFPRLRSP